MARLTDAETLRRYKSALKEWKVTGYVTWKDIAVASLKKELPGYTLRAVAELMHRYVEGGGEIDRVRERRAQWCEYEYHYDLRLLIEGQKFYIETLLLDDDPDDLTIHVVSFHPA
ncbi:MAG: hypothetical protein HY000_34970 [Planctomycetes bacterium]|nr:hypothetical protein [Planctomycetota bacterium]